MPIYKTNKKKNGLSAYRVRVSYVDAYGAHKQIERTVYGAAEARSEEVRLYVQLESREISARRITLSALYDEFQAVKQSEIKFSTAKNRDSIFKNHILPFLGNVNIQKINSQVLQKWKNELLKKNMATSSRRMIFIELSSLLNYAVQMEYLTSNPIKRINNFIEPIQVEASEKLHFYTPEQFVEFAKIAKNKSAESFKQYQAYAFFVFAYFTGARIGEILALRWSDLRKNKVKIEKSLNKYNVETAPKTQSSVRVIDIPAPLMEVLEENKTLQRNVAGFSESFRIFGGDCPLNRLFLRKFLFACAEKANLPRIRVHDFRHSYASLLANNGINIQEISRRLGHANVSMTWNIYSHMYPAEEARALSLLNSIKF